MWKETTTCSPRRSQAVKSESRRQRPTKNNNTFATNTTSSSDPLLQQQDDERKPPPQQREKEPRTVKYKCKYYNFEAIFSWKSSIRRDVVYPHHKWFVANLLVEIVTIITWIYLLCTASPSRNIYDDSNSNNDDSSNNNNNNNDDNTNDQAEESIPTDVWVWDMVVSVWFAFLCILWWAQIIKNYCSKGCVVNAPPSCQRDFELSAGFCLVMASTFLALAPEGPAYEYGMYYGLLLSGLYVTRVFETWPYKVFKHYDDRDMDNDDEIFEDEYFEDDNENYYERYKEQEQRSRRSEEKYDIVELSTLKRYQDQDNSYKEQQHDSRFEELRNSDRYEPKYVVELSTLKNYQKEGDKNDDKKKPKTDYGLYNDDVPFETNYTALV